MTQPSVAHFGIFDMQVCIPKDWTDKQILDFAESAYPSATSNGWQIRKEGDEDLNGDPERAQCHDFKDFVHVVLDA